MQESDMQVVVTTCMLATNEKRMLLTKQGFTEVNGLPDINDCVAQMQGEFNYVDESYEKAKEWGDYDDATLEQWNEEWPDWVIAEPEPEPVPVVIEPEVPAEVIVETESAEGIEGARRLQADN